MLLEDVRGQNILDHLDELEVPIIDGKDRRNLPLRRPQRDAIRKLLNWFENYVPTQVANVPLKTYKDSPPIDNAFLMVLPQRIGKTIAFSIAACRALEKTGKPSIYLHFEIPSLPDVEKVFVEVFRAYFGRDPIIHTFYDGKTFDEGVPDLVISSPQTQTGWEWKFAKKHPAQQRSYSALFADEAWGWATITRERLLREFDADYKIGMTGMKHRLDDVRNVKKYVRPGAATEFKHRIERIFGHAKSEYSLSQAFEDGELQKPNVRLFATNEGPTMHEILRGKYDKRKLNIHQKSMRINLDYLDVNLTIYAEKDFAQHLIYSKTKNHLNDMQMLHEGLKNPAQLVETFSQNEDWVDLVPRLEELLQKHERAIQHIIANDTEVIPVHSGLSPKIKNENRDRFLSPVPGAIGLAVDMLRSSVSLKHLGYTFQTGNTSSVQKWMQTAMRMVGNDDAEVIDVSHSFELISQVLRNSPRYEKIRYLVEHLPKHGPQEIPLNDLRLDEQHMLLNEVEAAFPEPEDFMFALHAHAFKLWSQRSSRASRKVAIKLPATIECANGIMVKLTFEENPNVHDWLKDLPPSSDGGLDLDPDQLALLEKLDVPTRYDEIQEYVNSISVNVPEKRHQRKVEKAKEYFESDTFWEGLEAFKKMRAHVAERLNLDDYYDYNIHDGVITGKYLFNSNSRIRKYFDSDDVDENELETVEGTGTKFNLRTWYKNTASHFPYASDYIRIGCFNDGIIFEDEVILRELVQKTFDDLDSQIDGISQTGTVVLEKFKVEPETQITLGELGTFTTTHRTTFSAIEVLEAQAKHVLATKGPRAYLKTAYFSVAVSAYERWKVLDNEAMLPSAKEITLHTGPHSGLPFSLMTPDAPRGVNPDGSETRKYLLKERVTFEFSEWYKTVTSPEFVQELSESEIQWLNYIGVSARVPSEFELALAYATNVTNEQIETDRHATHSISLHSNKQFVVFDKGAEIPLTDGSIYIVPKEFRLFKNWLEHEIIDKVSAYNERYAKHRTLTDLQISHAKLIQESGYEIAVNAGQVQAKVEIALYKKWHAHPDFEYGAEIPKDVFLEKGSAIDLGDDRVPYVLPFNYVSGAAVVQIEKGLAGFLSSHLMFSEDGMTVNPEISDYWLKNRQALKDLDGGMLAALTAAGLFRELGAEESFKILDAAIKRPKLVAPTLPRAEVEIFDFALEYAFHLNFPNKNIEVQQTFLTSEDAAVIFHRGLFMDLPNGQLVTLKNEKIVRLEELERVLRESAERSLVSPDETAQEKLVNLRESGWEYRANVNNAVSVVNLKIIDNWMRSSTILINGDIPAEFNIAKGEAVIMPQGPDLTLPVDAIAKGIWPEIKGQICNYLLVNMDLNVALSAKHTKLQNLVIKERAKIMANCVATDAIVHRYSNDELQGFIDSADPTLLIHEVTKPRPPLFTKFELARAYARFVAYDVYGVETHFYSVTDMVKNEDNTVLTLSPGSVIEKENGEYHVVDEAINFDLNDIKKSLDEILDRTNPEGLDAETEESRYRQIKDSGYEVAVNRNQVASQLLVSIYRKWMKDPDFNVKNKIIPEHFRIDAGDEINLNGDTFIIPDSIETTYIVDIIGNALIETLYDNLEYLKINRLLNPELIAFAERNYDALEDARLTNSIHPKISFEFFHEITPDLALQIMETEVATRDRVPSTLELAIAFAHNVAFTRGDDADEHHLPIEISQNPVNGNGPAIHTFKRYSQIKTVDDYIIEIVKDTPIPEQELSAALLDVLDNYYNGDRSQSSMQNFARVRDTCWELHINYRRLNTSLNHDIVRSWINSEEPLNQKGEIPDSFDIDKGTLFTFDGEPSLVLKNTKRAAVLWRIYHSDICKTLIETATDWKSELPIDPTYREWVFKNFELVAASAKLSLIGAELDGEPNSTKEETMKFIDELDSSKVIAALEQSFAPKFQQELGTQRSLEA